MTDDKKLCVCGCNKNVFATWSPPAGECVQMTDDKGAGEGPYGHKKYPIAGGGKKHSQSCQACAYAEGRKAERERCAKIADGYFNARGRVVAKAIRGGQDAK